ncbi:HD-GYP domain-containing protein [Pseudobdellovibrio exovorus]|uniref:Integral HD domain-containing protein n=1 Tax=Pseudobdellovibrio exovorus JSS TaxID=1184267 RepID=M4V7L8_9BACT|nr:HD-GYP domain-containing protein [Pseudobdellovibrio exovorus]AGH95208.1 integral HD domain-containing protein [Pseudobdellovibrio exovorus JSS]
MAWDNIPDWSYDSVRALLEALKSVEPSTYHHCLRVGEYSRKLAESMGLNEYEQKVAEFSGLLHDIGKMGIDRAVLLKPGKLDPQERDIIRNHSILSEQIIKPFSADPFFQQIIPAVRGHHERLDGEGYPDKLIGDEIPLMARIILVVDTYDAMSEDRIYRKGLPDDVIYAELKRCSGSQFDAQLVKIFLSAHRFWKKSEKDEETSNLIIRKIA